METRQFAAIALLVASSTLCAAPHHPPLVAHEWGTFTSVQGADGVQLWWTPLIKTDLPSFVYSADRLEGAVPVSSGERKSTSALVRMETPVIYFYSDSERAVDVRVVFPMGRITEWYPRASRVEPYRVSTVATTQTLLPPLIEWKGVRILRRDTREISARELIRDRAEEAPSHYYSARATDANLLGVASPAASGGKEHERDLFYRGVGFFPGPLIAKMDAGESELTLSTESGAPLRSLFILTVRHGLMRYQQIDPLDSQNQTTVALNATPFGALNDVRERVMRDVTVALVHQGLYTKEARAMVGTWKDQWFAEEGTRVLYLLPRVWTDRVLPLQISPRPDNVVRVMVGRAELITPAAERGLRQQIIAYSSGDPLARDLTVENVRSLGLGRFLEPATTKALGDHADPHLVLAARELGRRASAPKPSRPDVAGERVPVVRN